MAFFIGETPVKKQKICSLAVVAVLMLAGSLSFTGTVWAMQEIKDRAGRSMVLPSRVTRIICSGPGSLRLASYLGAQDLVVAVDDIEHRKRRFDARPYALANPGYRSLPVFGGFRGQDDPEKILGLDPLPQVIFKTYASSGHDPVALERKTGIPVVVLEYGDLGRGRENLFSSLMLMGQILDKNDRAKAVVDFFKSEIAVLSSRTKDITTPKRCFIGGIAFKGPHGFNSTEPLYPPLEFVNGLNIAGIDLPLGKQVRQTMFSKEKILAMDPEVVFLDLSTMQMGKGQGGLFELQTDPVYQALTAVRNKSVYGLLPYNWYTSNFGSVLADAWYIGKVLYPERFEDIVPEKEADRIYRFLLSAEVFNEMNKKLQNKAFTRVLSDTLSNAGQ